MWLTNFEAGEISGKIKTMFERMFKNNEKLINEIKRLKEENKTLKKENYMYRVKLIIKEEAQKISKSLQC